MLLLLRRLKHDLFMNDKLSRYFGYAIGELILVVVGILVALQIDNWNEDRKERATLQSYLESIARNMREDLAELPPLRQHRVESLYLSSRFQAIRNQERFHVHEITFFNRLWSHGSAEVFFSANTSGFDALKNSGVLNRLQGSELERLLSRYFDTVDQIRVLESVLNDALTPLGTELRQKQPEELESWGVSNPGALTPERFQAVQPLYAELIHNPTTSALVDAQFRSVGLVKLYDSLAVLGEAFIEAVESGQPDSDLALPRTPLDDFMEGLGPAEFIVEGRNLSESYFLTTVSGPSNDTFRLDSIRFQDGAMHVSHPGGEDWAVVFWGTVAPAPPEGLAYQDYSRFSKLVLEARGESGGEVIKAHVKDADYPNDIDPISVDLLLSDDWQTFEIDLAEFAPNDLSRLHVPLGLLIYPAQEPTAFSVRNARYR
jgi:hypothetical protein